VGRKTEGTEATTYNPKTLPKKTSQREMAAKALNLGLRL
jgi:hypothetical protein